MKRVRNDIYLLVLGAVIVSLNACSGGGGGGGGGSSNTATVTAAYPDPNNPSAFPTRVDDIESSASDNESATASSINVDGYTPPFNNVQYRTIYPVGDVDWVKVNLPNAIPYEFSIDNVSSNAIITLSLYESDGTQIGVLPALGYFEYGSNPRILFTPPTGGNDYYLKVANYLGSVASYTLSAHEFKDEDLDSYSTYYDCNDNAAPDYHPELVETQGGGGTAGDSMDQSCTGYDWLKQTLEDSHEGNDTYDTASTLPMAKGDTGDVIHRQEVYALTHTIDTVSGDDVDYFKVTVPPHSAYEVVPIEATGATLRYTIYDDDGTAWIEGPDDFYWIWLDNTGTDAFYNYLNPTPETEKVWYICIEATGSDSCAGNLDMTTGGNNSVYAAGIVDYGTDADNDGYFTKGQAYDCDDNDGNIYAGAAEEVGDGVDSNCNGEDDT